MRSFKPGAFELALSSRVPIQPLVIRGSGDALPKRGFVLQGRHTITVTVLDPVLPDKFADRTAEDLSHELRNLIQCELDKTEYTT